MKFVPWVTTLLCTFTVLSIFIPTNRASVADVFDGSNDIAPNVRRRRGITSSDADESNVFNRRSQGTSGSITGEGTDGSGKGVTDGEEDPNQSIKPLTPNHQSGGNNTYPPLNERPTLPPNPPPPQQQGPSPHEYGLVEIVVGPFFLVASALLILALTYSILFICVVRLGTLRIDEDLYPNGRVYLFGNRCYVPLCWFFRLYARDSQGDVVRLPNGLRVAGNGTGVKALTKEERREALEVIFECEGMCHVAPEGGGRAEDDEGLEGNKKSDSDDGNVDSEADGSGNASRKVTEEDMKEKGSSSQGKDRVSDPPVKSTTTTVADKNNDENKSEKKVISTNVSTNEQEVENGKNDEEESKISTTDATTSTSGAVLSPDTSSATANNSSTLILPFVTDTDTYMSPMDQDQFLLEDAEECSTNEDEPEQSHTSNKMSLAPSRHLLDSSSYQDSSSLLEMSTAGDTTAAIVSSSSLPFATSTTTTSSPSVHRCSLSSSIIALAPREDDDEDNENEDSGDDDTFNDEFDNQEVENTSSTEQKFEKLILGKRMRRKTNRGSAILSTLDKVVDEEEFDDDDDRDDFSIDLERQLNPKDEDVDTVMDTVGGLQSLPFATDTETAASADDASLNTDAAATVNTDVDTHAAVSPHTNVVDESNVDLQHDEISTSKNHGNKSDLQKEDEDVQTFTNQGKQQSLDGQHLRLSFAPEDRIDEDDDSDDDDLPEDDEVASFVSNTSSRDMELTCIICFDTYDEGDIYVSSRQCTHRFHRDCLLDWLARRNNTNCPCCRRDIITNDDVIDVARRIRLERRRQRRKQKRASALGGGGGWRDEVKYVLFRWEDYWDERRERESRGSIRGSGGDSSGGLFPWRRGGLDEEGERRSSLVVDDNTVAAVAARNVPVRQHRRRRRRRFTIRGARRGRISNRNIRTDQHSPQDQASDVPSV